MVTRNAHLIFFRSGLIRYLVNHTIFQSNRQINMTSKTNGYVLAQVENKSLKPETVHVTLRCAVRDDLPGILNIRREEDMDNRVDYLAARWNEWFDKPNFYSHVGLIRNEIVCFAFSMVIDGGRTVFQGGIRCISKLKGWDTILPLANNMLVDIREKTPNVENVMAVSSFKPFYENTPFYNIVEKRGYRCYFTSTEELLSKEYLLSPGDAQSSVISPESSVVHSVMLDPVNSPLFPIDRFCVDYRSYAVSADNIPMVADRWKIHMTMDPEQAGRCFAISFLSYYDGETARCLNVEIYARQDNFITEHVKKALQYFNSLDYSGKVVLEIQFPKDLSPSVDRMLSSAEINPSSHSSHYIVVLRTNC